MIIQENYIDWKIEGIVNSHRSCMTSYSKQRILSESFDPQTAILLLDFILGNNASTDPARELLDAILAAKRNAKKQGGI